MRTVSLESRVIAITGGARGIGLASAEALARKGARIAIGDVDRARAEEAARRMPAPAIGLPLDVGEPQSVDEFIGRTEAELGPVHGLLNNAAINVLGPLLDTDHDAIERQVEVNLMGPINCIRAAGARMAARRRGHIVGVSSTAGRMALPDGAVYCATKYAVLGLSESLRGELSRHGIDVSVVLPHITRTRMITGQPEPAGMPPLEPERVGRAIAGVFRRPRPTTYVPAWHRGLHAVGGHVPSVLRDPINRRLGFDRAFTYDPVQRADYHEDALRAER